MSKQDGMITIEYILIVVLIILFWNFSNIVKQAVNEHQESIFWSLSQYNR